MILLTCHPSWLDGSLRQLFRVMALHMVWLGDFHDHDMLLNQEQGKFYLIFMCTSKADGKWTQQSDKKLCIIDTVVIKKIKNVPYM